MIPYRADDADNPTVAIPVVTIGLIVVNFLVFFYELALGAQGSHLDTFINGYSLVPCSWIPHVWRLKYRSGIGDAHGWRQACA